MKVYDQKEFGSKDSSLKDFGSKEYGQKDYGQMDHGTKLSASGRHMQQSPNGDIVSAERGISPDESNGTMSMEYTMLGKKKLRMARS